MKLDLSAEMVYTLLQAVIVDIAAHRQKMGTMSFAHSSLDQQKVLQEEMLKLKVLHKMLLDLHRGD